MLIERALLYYILPVWFIYYILFYFSWIICYNLTKSVKGYSNHVKVIHKISKAINYILHYTILIIYMDDGCAHMSDEALKHSKYMFILTGIMDLIYWVYFTEN
jgi:hypothetical protein